jgi:Mg-chelatase subunit ChlD
MNGGTNIAAALTQAGAALKAGPGAAAPAPGAARLVVLLTDGRVDGYQSREAKVMSCAVNCCRSMSFNVV